MNAPATARTKSAHQSAEHFDVLIVGAGISGIGSAYHLTTQLPGTSFVILEAQESFGGTWLTHRYPGIRSDSDLHTFGYRFKPWTSAPIATAAEIRSYMGEVIAENGLERHIRYRHRISSASWSSLTNRWTIEAVRTDSGETVTLHREFPVDVPGLLSALRGLYAAMAGHGELQGPHRSPADLAGGSRLPGQEGRRHRFGRHGGDPDSGDRRRLRSRHDAAALADLFQDRPQCHRTRRDAAPAPGRARNGSTRSCAGRSCSIRTSSPAARSRSPRSRQEGTARRYSRGARSGFR